MATPKGTQGVSTPKNPVISTPNRPTASPRPLAGSFATKTLSYKSPAVKTPASLHGHSHRASISSQQISTPLAAPAIHDELLNLNSPAAALIASIGNTGLTPLATGQDGLGITGGITPSAGRDAPLPPKNPEVGRLNRLEQVAKLLKSRVSGHGITREGIERIAQIQGFTILWDEENLTIAGNSVDLEIIFDAVTRDVVRDVQLRLNTSGSDEPQLQRDASNVLKQHLMVTDAAIVPTEAWKSLKPFAQDLEYLSQLDFLGGSVNCFELMGGLYTTFRKIWDEEKKRMRERGEAALICQGNVGQPHMDHGNRLGVVSRYWLNRQNYRTVVAQSKNVALEEDEPWVATFSCAKGDPGINADNIGNWLESEVLKSTVTTEEVFQEGQIEKPNWSASKSLDEQQKDANAMMLDGPEDGSLNILHVVFTCNLDFPVHVPVNVLNALNSQYPMVQIDQSKALTYQQALLNASKSTSIQDWNPNIRWHKQFSFYNGDGHLSPGEHSFSLYANGVPWAFPVDRLKFSHPSQYADALSILRQYALLWSILRNTLGDDADANSKTSHAATTRVPDNPIKMAKVTKRSNKGTAHSDLTDLLSSRDKEDMAPRIDLSIDLLTDVSKAKLGVIVPLPYVKGGRKSGDFAHVTIEVHRNGRLDVPSITGLSGVHEEKLRRRALKVLGLGEDIGILAKTLLEDIKMKAE